MTYMSYYIRYHGTFVFDANYLNNIKQVTVVMMLNRAVFEL